MCISIFYEIQKSKPCSEGGRAVVAAGGVEPLLALAKGGTAEQKEHAACALANLMHDYSKESEKTGGATAGRRFRAPETRQFLSSDAASPK